MSETTGEVQHETLLARAQSNTWRWQLQALIDLQEFIAAHGPLNEEPLATVNWTLGQTRTVAAEIWAHTKDPLTILRSYAAALRVGGIHTVELPNRTIYRVAGRIGVLGGPGSVYEGMGRTQLIVAYTERKDEG